MNVDERLYICDVKIFRSLSLVVLCLALTKVTAYTEAPNTAIGTYSRRATDLWSRTAGSSKPFEVLSPDKKSSVRAKYEEDSDGEAKVLLQTDGAIGSIQVDLGPGVGSELLWSPDSKSFFTTTSDQGLNGSYRLIVVGRFGGKLVNRDITPLIYRQFGQPVVCGWPEEPNVGGITWLGNSRVLVAAEIINHSNCDSFGTFKAYEVDPENMKVDMIYNQLETNRLFGDFLGDELKSAPDECIRNPKFCYVSTNHPAK
jgi:hypothetical protein